MDRSAPDTPGPSDINTNSALRRDGKRFAALKSSGTERDAAMDRVNIVLNWIVEVKQKLPTGKKQFRLDRLNRLPLVRQVLIIGSYGNSGFLLLKQKAGFR